MPDTQAATMTAEQAYEGMMARVAEPAFFDKLASEGIVPGTAEEAATLVSMGDKLAAYRDSELDKQAASIGDTIRAAAAELDQRLGIAPGPTSKAAAAGYVADPASLAYAVALTRYQDLTR